MYGLTQQDLELVKVKIKKQKSYLESFEILKPNTGEIKTLLDYSYSANLSTRYYARILNRVHTFVSLGISKSLTPVFLTVTLDGFFRDMLRGDYTRFTPKMIDKYLKHIPNNDRNGNYWDYIRDGSYSDITTKKSYGKRLSVKDLYKILSHQIYRFNRSKTLQDIRQKYSQDYMSIRVTEPHKDGVPHLHILMYLPEPFIDDLYRDFHKFFPAPRNSKIITIKDGGRVAKPLTQYSDLLETHGFQTQIRSAPAYILKYILKSFRNMIEGKDIDYLQAWYIHNRIPRIITTHSLLSQEAFHHFSLLENDWFYLTNIKRDYKCESNKVFKQYLLEDNKRKYLFNNGLYQYYVDGKLIKEFGECKTYKMKFTSKYPYFIEPKNLQYSIHIDSYRYFKFIPKKKYIYHIEKNNLIPVMVNGIEKYYDLKTHNLDYKYRFLSIDRIPSSLLYQWYKSFDFDKYNPCKYGFIKRTLIQRKVIDEIDNFKLDDFYIDSFFDKLE